MLVKYCTQQVRGSFLEPKIAGQIEKRVLPLDNQSYRYLRFRAIGNLEISGFNGNWDGFPYEEFENSTPGYGYKSFIGKKAHLEHNCIVPDTLILMSDMSYKPIQNIEIEDEVITHTGEIKEVLNVFEHLHTEGLVKLNVEGILKPLFFTSKHPLWIINKEVKEKGMRKLANFRNNNNKNFSIEESKYLLSSYLEDPKWVLAKDVKEKDYMILPYPKVKRVINPEINGKDFARFLGFYTAEGSIAGNKNVWNESLNQVIQFSFNSKEREYIDFIHSFAKTRNINSDEHIAASKDFGTDSCIIVNMYSSLYADIVNLHCGRNAKKKTLSEDIMKMPAEWQKEFLKSYFEGDANINLEQGIKGSTASKHLALQIQQLCLMNNVWCNVKEFRQHTPNDSYVKNSFGNPIFVFRITGNEARILFGNYFKFNDKANNSAVAKTNFGFIVPIKQKENVEYEGYVYNIEVDDNNSYTVYNTAVHNSSMKDRGAIGDLPDAYLNRLILPEGIQSWSSIGSKDHTEKRFSILNMPGQRDGAIEVLMRLDLNRINNPSVDKDVRRKLAQLIQDIDSGKTLTCSMGTNCQKSRCSVCGNEAVYAVDYCSHMKSRKGSLHVVSANEIRDLLDREHLKAEWLKHIIASSFDQDEVLKGISNKGIAVRAGEINQGLSFFELSIVRTPAYVEAFALENLSKVASQDRQQYLYDLRKKVGDENILDLYSLLQEDGLVSSLCSIR